MQLGGSMWATSAGTGLPILLVIGFAIFVGSIGARVFQRLHVPQVVGYIVIGVLAGRSGLRLIDDRTIQALLPFNAFALGLIGFMIGGELRGEVFRKYGRQFFKILFAEGMGAFVTVGLLVGTTAALVTGDVITSVALGLMFGALSSATAPAATVNVLWEYKTRGVLTTAVFAVVALDDALALVLFSIASSLVGKLTGQAEGGVLGALGFAAYELIGAAVLGVAAGLGLNFVLRRARDPGRAFPFVVGALLLTVGAGTLARVDTILAAMALGVTLVNLAPRRTGTAFDVLERFATPVYVLFFVMVGAHLNVLAMPAWVWALALPYIVGRSAGKILGANLGARLAGAAPVLRKYLGWCLFCQGGVAVGLSLLARHRFPGQIGDAIIMIIAVTTFVVEVIGPAFVKFAVQRAGEVGLDVTEEDLIASYRVADVVNRRSPKFTEGTTLAEMLETIAATEAMSYPVTDERGQLSGMITIQDLKNALGGVTAAEWLVALDLMQPAPDTVSEDVPLAEALTRMREQDLESLPVVSAGEDAKLVGVLELRAVNRVLSQEVLRRRRLAGV